MSWWLLNKSKRLTSQLRSLLRKGKPEEDLAEEVQFHLDNEIAKNVKGGMTPQEARYAALRTFGGVDQVKEHCRDIRGIRLVEEFLQDVRYGLRTLRKSPGFTSVAVVTLGLAISANTTIFSVVYAVLLRPLPYPNPEQIMLIWADNPKLQIDLHDLPPSNADIRDWRSQNRVFQALAAFRSSPGNLSDESGAERVGCAGVTADFFPVLGVAPTQGRWFTSAEEQPGKNRVVVISHNLWQRRFGAAPDLVGQSLKLNGVDFTVIGIMPPTFHFPRQTDLPTPYVFLPQTDVWVPLDYGPQEWAHRLNRNLVAIGRLKPHVSLGQAQAEMDALSQRQAEDFPDSNAGWIVRLVPLGEYLVGNTRLALLVLFGAVSCVLLIACANVANLLLARAAGRQREIAIRTSLGAGRMRIIRQLLTESILLATLGGCLGLMLSRWGLSVLLALAPPTLPRTESVGIGAWVVAFGCALSLVSSLLFGLVPALQVSRLDLYGSLREAGTTSRAGGKRRRIRGFLVAGEVALACMLLICAMLLTQSFRRIMKVDPGLNVENLLTMNVSLSDPKYHVEDQMDLFQEQVLEQISAVPQVSYVGAIFQLPLASPGIYGPFRVEWNSYASSAAPYEIGASKGVVSPDYFRAMGIPLLKGRYFDSRDSQVGIPVAIVSQSLARSLWPHGDPLGKRIGPQMSQSEWHSVVGVVGDVKHNWLETKSTPTLYVPYSQTRSSFLKSDMTFAVRTLSPPSGILSAIRREIQAVDKNIPAFKIQTMKQIVDQSVAEPRFNMLLLVSFAGFAVLLAVMGIYGVMSYTAAQRTHEIGIRIALGALHRDIVRLLLKEGMALALAGLAIGLGGAFAVTRILSSLLYEIDAKDPFTFAAVSLLLMFVATSACFVPALQASQVNPIEVIRNE